MAGGSVDGTADGIADGIADIRRDPADRAGDVAGLPTAAGCRRCVGGSWAWQRKHPHRRRRPTDRG
jgi:hypothetical protein